MGFLPTNQITALKPNPFFESDIIRAVAKINGRLYLILSYDITLNVHGASDTAQIVLSILGANNDFSQEFVAAQATSGSDAQIAPVYVQIYAGFPANGGNNSVVSIDGLSLRFAGIIDQYTASFDQDEVTFQCRSYAAPLMTEKIQAPFGSDPNQTVITNSSTTQQLVQYVAQKYNLQYKYHVLNTPLTMQQVLTNEYETGIHVYSIWSLLIACALQDDVDVWVDQYGTLWYYDSGSIPRTNVTLTWGRDLQSLSLNHALQFSRNIEVRVHSYTPKTRESTSVRGYTAPDGTTYQAQAISKTTVSTPVFGLNQTITQTTSPYGVTSTSTSTTQGGAATASTSAPPTPNSGKQVYEYWMPNKTQAECFDLAAKIYRQIVLHEYQVSIKLPVTPALLNSVNITSAIRVVNAPYTYPLATSKGLWPRQLRETLSPSSGWVWDIDATNITPPQGGA
jgi:hypothetical protein